MKHYLLFTFCLSLHAWSAVPVSPLVDQPGGQKLATIENESIRLSFVPATRGGQVSARPLIEVRTASGWVDAPVDAAAESYQVLYAPETVKMVIPIRDFPSEEYTLLQTQAPTPMSLMQVGPLSWAVSGDPGSEPFEFPVPAKSRYGLHIRNPHPNGQGLSLRVLRPGPGRRIGIPVHRPRDRLGRNGTCHRAANHRSQPVTRT